MSADTTESKCVREWNLFRRIMDKTPINFPGVCECRQQRLNDHVFNWMEAFIFLLNYYYRHCFYHKPYWTFVWSMACHGVLSILAIIVADWHCVSVILIHIFYGYQFQATIKIYTGFRVTVESNLYNFIILLCWWINVLLPQSHSMHLYHSQSFQIVFSLFFNVPKNPSQEFRK